MVRLRFDRHALPQIRYFIKVKNSGTVFLCEYRVRNAKRHDRIIRFAKGGKAANVAKRKDLWASRQASRIFLLTARVLGRVQVGEFKS